MAIITLSRDDFLAKLNLAAKFVATRSGVAALQGVMLKLDQSGLQLHSSNLSSYFHTKIEVNGEPSKALIDHKKIIEFVQLLNAADIKLEFLDTQLKISQGKTRGNFALIESADFPDIPVAEGELKKGNFKTVFEALPLVVFAASHDETRPILTGINFVNVEDELHLVATDGFRLSIAKIKNKIHLPSAIIPNDFLNEIMRNLSSSESVGIEYLDKEKMLHINAVEDNFYTRIIDGEYPPYNRVIPTQIESTATVSRQDLIRSVKLISVFARDFSQVVIMDFASNSITIKPKKEANSENTTVQECVYKGEEMSVAFNYKYLIDCLNNLKTEEVEIDLLRLDAPVVFKEKNSQRNFEFIHIIMPIRVQ